MEIFQSGGVSKIWRIIQVEDYPKYGVLTHLDKVGLDKVSKVKNRLEDHFCTEICGAARFSSLSGLEEDGLYNMLEINHLGEMLSDSQFLPLSWRAEHPYVLVDRFEVHGDKQCNRNLSLYGYLRGCDIKKGTKVHIAGAGDFSLAGITRSFDPCPLKVDDSFRFCRTGNYLRLDVLDVPYEIVENFESHHYPILVGDILPEEEPSGFMMVKLRRHSWHENLLMSGVPNTVSAGSRRYQTNAIYAMENQNGHHRLLKYTPEHKNCVSFFWGPPVPPKTTIAVVMNKFYSLKDENLFRIMAKGVVLDFNNDTEILLKGKKMATVQTDGKTACIKLASGLEPDRFIGAPIQTSSGVRGRIDKSSGGAILECTFKDIIRMGDIFLFPVLATLVLPSLFKQLNFLFKHLEIPTIATDDAYAAITDAAAATINFVATDTVHFGATITVNAEDELAFLYKEDAPRRKMPYLRRGVLIHEGRCCFLSFPDPLEIEQRLIKRRKRCAAQEISGEVKKEHSFDRSGEEAKEEQISGEVKGKDSLNRSGWEAMVIADDESVSALELFQQRCPPPGM
ncbi:ribosome biogenesis protein BMS1 homolog [Papaver somniferum]|uniref:ribosome biogenesis protein BMS1 homolog n=1 Tax=Papaver somniferum TaxID=3469 RepID=UPI000E6F7B0D|nr:ribosome biogenesis protein BMS1 homolog [Papaver somniferum]